MHKAYCKLRQPVHGGELAMPPASVRCLGASGSPAPGESSERRRVKRGIVAFMKTTLCYIEQDGCYLMLLRNKKARDAA